MKFMLSITLGNDAMQDSGDVADALRRIANEIESDGWGTRCAGGYTAQTVFDINGNTVGQFKVRK